MFLIKKLYVSIARPVLFWLSNIFELVIILIFIFHHFRDLFRYSRSTSLLDWWFRHIIFGKLHCFLSSGFFLWLLYSLIPTITTLTALLDAHLVLDLNILSEFLYSIFLLLSFHPFLIANVCSKPTKLLCSWSLLNLWVLFHSIWLVGRWYYRLACNWRYSWGAYLTMRFTLIKGICLGLRVFFILLIHARLRRTRHIVQRCVWLHWFNVRLI